MIYREDFCTLEKEKEKGQKTVLASIDLIFRKNDNANDNSAEN